MSIAAVSPTRTTDRDGKWPTTCGVGVNRTVVVVMFSTFSLNKDEWAFGELKPKNRWFCAEEEKAQFLSSRQGSWCILKDQFEENKSNLSI